MPSRSLTTALRPQAGATHPEGRQRALTGLLDLLPDALAALRDELASEDLEIRRTASRFVLSHFVSPDKGERYASTSPAAEPQSPSQLAQWAILELSQGRMTVEHYVSYVEALSESLSLEERSLMVGAVADFVTLQRAANAPLINQQSESSLMQEILR